MKRARELPGLEVIVSLLGGCCESRLNERHKKDDSRTRRSSSSRKGAVADMPMSATAPIQLDYERRVSVLPH